MLNKLISLVLLFIFLITGNVISDDKFLLPVKKPSIFKNSEKIKDSKILPQSKPSLKTTKKKNIDKDKINVINNQKTKKTEISNNKEIKFRTAFILPRKKPVTYTIISNESKKSTILTQKDFEKAKETIKFIKAKKWNSALKSSNKIKDKDFRDLITWMYLKTTGNSATFSDYKKFIERNPDYPRINRIKYLAEQKIYLRNMSPTSVINWFQKNPPLGGLGKIKLAEAYLEQANTEEVKKLIKEGWTTAEIRKNDLGYYRAKFKNFLNFAL